jgi:hypothetical protein
MALGAEPAGVVRIVLVRVFVLVALGVIIGTVVSWWSSQFIASLLYDLQPRDAVTLVSAAVTLTVVGAVAVGSLPTVRRESIRHKYCATANRATRLRDRSIEALRRSRPSRPQPLQVDPQRRHRHSPSIST